MTDFSAQGSVRIQRMRNGDTLFLVIESNGIPLFQAVDTETGEVSPDWTVDANRPVLTPTVSTGRGASVTLSSHSWEYNGTTLVFNGEEDGSYVIDSTGKFEMNPNTGALKIIDNIASADNYANDTLVYSGKATYDAQTYDVSKSLDIVIHKAGASSYTAYIQASSSIIDTTITETTLTTMLVLSLTSLSDYYVVWYKGAGRTELTDRRGQQSVTITKDDVDGITTFIGDFYLSEADYTAGNSPVASAGINITDKNDEYYILYVITSENKSVDAGKPVTVKGYIKNMTKGTIVEVENATWLTEVLNLTTWQPTQSVAGREVTVTTADTDSGDEPEDVEVVGSVEW